MSSIVKRALTGFGILLAFSVIALVLFGWLRALFSENMDILSVLIGIGTGVFPIAYAKRTYKTSWADLLRPDAVTLALTLIFAFILGAVFYFDIVNVLSLRIGIMAGALMSVPLYEYRRPSPKERTEADIDQGHKIFGGSVFFRVGIAGLAVIVLMFVYEFGIRS